MVKRPRFHPLSRDYWHAGATYPAVRVVLAFLLTPVVTVALLLLLLTSFTVVLGESLDTVLSRASSVAVVALYLTCGIVWTLGVVAFLVLWTLRYRGRLHYLAAGTAIGLATAFGVPLISVDPAPVTVFRVVIFTVYFAVTMLVFRIIAGVRRFHD